MQLRIIVTGRSYDQAADLPESIELQEDATLEHAIAAVNQRLAESQLSASCLIAVAGEHVGSVGAHDNPALREGQEITFIQPVAGG